MPGGWTQEGREGLAEAAAAALAMPACREAAASSDKETRGEMAAPAKAAAAAAQGRPGRSLLAAPDTLHLSLGLVLLTLAAEQAVLYRPPPGAVVAGQGAKTAPPTLAAGVVRGQEPGLPATAAPALW